MFFSIFIPTFSKSKFLKRHAMPDFLDRFKKVWEKSSTRSFFNKNLHLSREINCPTVDQCVEKCDKVVDSRKKWKYRLPFDVENYSPFASLQLFLLFDQDCQIVAEIFSPNNNYWAKNIMEIEIQNRIKIQNCLIYFQ